MNIHGLGFKMYGLSTTGEDVSEPSKHSESKSNLQVISDPQPLHKKQAVFKLKLGQEPGKILRSISRVRGIESMEFARGLPGTSTDTLTVVGDMDIIQLVKTLRKNVIAAPELVSYVQGKEKKEDKKIQATVNTLDATVIKNQSPQPLPFGSGHLNHLTLLDIPGSSEKQRTMVEKEAQDNISSNCKITQDELQDLSFQRTQIDFFLKGILYILGKSNDFEMDKLIQLWMAGGFIENEPMEVIGVMYFKKLASEGYILSLNAQPLYRVNIDKLNFELDSILEKSNCLRLESASQSNAASIETLHVAVVGVGDEIDEKIFKMLRRFDKLRTLLFLGNHGSRLQQVPRDLFLCLEALQALDLSGTHIKELPSSAEKMTNLRYLDLSWTFIEHLPERIDRFGKLQTLKLKGCSRLQRLPKEMKRLTELRHLDLDVLGQLVSFPEGIGALAKLRTLSAFCAGEEEGFKISELRYLNNLTGEFCVANLENVRSANEAKQATLEIKRHIKKLELRWSDYECEEPKMEEEDILEKLCPSIELEEIQIVHYHGTKLPTWISLVSFHKLFRITLFRCEYVSTLPLLGKLPSLHTLELIGLNSVRKMDFADELHQGAFPVLKKLSIDEMHNLETWIEAEEVDFPCIVELTIQDCPKLSNLPSLVYLSSVKYLEVSGCAKLAFWSEKRLSSSLRKLIIEDCPLIEERFSEEGSQDWHKIQHVPTIWIDQVEIQSCEDDSEDSP